MNNKKPTLQNLIESLKLGYINKDITNENFPDDGRLLTDSKVFDFNKLISSEEAIAEMKKDGYIPANLREMLFWAKDNWDNKNWVTALGSVYRHWHVGRGVPWLWRDAGGRGLYLGAFADGWDDGFRFLAVRESAALGHLEVGSLESLEARLLELEKDMEKIKKFLII